MRAWWWLRRPDHAGALVAIWVQGEVLVIRQSYRPTLTFPGGGLRRGEAPLEAARRELREEIGFEADASALTLAYETICRVDFRRDHVCIFELRLPAAPALRLDRREVVAARFMQPAELRRARLSPPVAFYLAGLAAPPGTPPAPETDPADPPG